MAPLKPSLLFAVVMLMAIVAGCNPPDSPSDPSLPASGEFDGLSQACFDSVVRIRNRGGTGCGNAVAYLDSNRVEVESLSDAEFVELETNRHVALDRGADQIVDVWFEGDLVASKRTKTHESWFRNGQSKDIATIHVPLEQLGGPMAVVPRAPYGNNVSKGDMVFTVGCSDGRHPRARCANVLSVRNGLIYYDPKSIGGDSGGPVYAWSKDRKRFETVGRTAWAIKEGGDWVGLAMTSDRIADIRSGRVADGNWELPDGAVELKSLQCFLPENAVRCDELPCGNCDSSQNPTEAEPVPLEVQSRRPGWIFPIKEGNAVEIRGERLGLWGRGRALVSDIFRFAFWFAVIAILVALYAGPTLLTPLKYDWPLKALVAVYRFLRPAVVIAFLLVVPATANAQLFQRFPQCGPDGCPPQITTMLAPPMLSVAPVAFESAAHVKSWAVESITEPQDWAPFDRPLEISPLAPAGPAFSNPPQLRKGIVRRFVRRIFRRCR